MKNLWTIIIWLLLSMRKQTQRPSTGFDARYNDDKNAVKGTRRYRRSFELPIKQRNTVELEVINKGNKDTSFVVISN